MGIKGIRINLQGEAIKILLYFLNLKFKMLSGGKINLKGPWSV